MNQSELDEQLAQRAPRLPLPASVESQPSAPLSRMIENVLALASAPVTPHDEAIDRAIRTPEASRIRDRLPVYLGHYKPAELAARVTDARLLKAARAWRWGARGMLFVGPTGLGKSSAAGWLFRRLLGEGWHDGGDAWDRAQGLRWFSAEALSLARREHSLGRGDAPEIVTASHAGLLFIDDAGWDRDPLAVSDILAVRYERERPTIITSGKTLEELSKHYGAAVVRRLVEAGGTKSLVVNCFTKAAA